MQVIKQEQGLIEDQAMLMKEQKQGLKEQERTQKTEGLQDGKTVLNQAKQGQNQWIKNEEKEISFIKQNMFGDINSRGNQV